MFLRKITVKSVRGSNPDIVAIKAAPTAGLLVLRVAGRVDRIIKRPSPYETDGEKFSRGLAGNFRAVHPDTGEVFDSTRAFLPAVVQESIEHALANRPEGSPADSAIEFGVDVFATVSSRDANKYEFRIKPFKAIETHSAVAEVLELAPALPALPAPAQHASEAQPQPARAASGKRSKRS